MTTRVDSYEDVPWSFAQLRRFHYTDERRPNANLRFEATSATPVTGINAGDEIVYTIKVVNDGPAAAGHVTLENQLPEGTTFLQFKPAAGWVIYDLPFMHSGKVVCSGFRLEPGQFAEFRLKVRVKTNVLVGTQIANTSTVDSLVPDLIMSNNTTTKTVTVQ